MSKFWILTFLLGPLLSIGQHQHKSHSDSVEIGNFITPYEYQLNAVKRNRFTYNYNYTFVPLNWMDSKVINQYTLEDSLLFTEIGVSNFNYNYGFQADNNFEAVYSDKLVDQSIFAQYLSNRNFGDLNHSKYKVENFRFATSDNEGKFRNHFHYISNKSNLTENGGLWKLENLNATDGANDIALFTNLNTAENLINELESSGGLGYYLIFNRDTLDSDSTDTRHNHVGFNINGEYQRVGYLYTESEGDIDSLFYNRTLFDTTATRDSLGYSFAVINPTIEMQLNNSQYMLGYREVVYTNALLNSREIEAGFSTRLEKLEMKSNCTYVMDGIWRGGIDGEFDFRRDSVLGGKLTGQVKFRNIYPEYPLLRYVGNHFNWNNTFNREFVLSVAMGLGLRDGWRYDASINVLQDYVYFDSSSLPKQAEESIYVLNTTVQRSIKKDHFVSFNKLGLQYSSSDVIRMPAVHATSTNAFLFDIIGMPTSVGFQAFYMTQHKGMAYNPNLRQFYIQDEQMVGGFPMLDVFLGLKAGGADLFVKVENILYQMLPKSDFLVYKDMITSPTFIRLGLNWHFEDK